MNQVIPLSAATSQGPFNISLNGQGCTLSIYQRFSGLYVDLTCKGTVIFTCRLATDRANLARNQAYRGFAGQLWFADLNGTEDPFPEGLGTRFLLLYTPPVS